MEVNKMDVSEALESEYLTVNDVKDSSNRILTIVNEGAYEEVDFGQGKKKRLTLGVDFNGKIKLWRPNKDSIKNLSDVWGRETKLWLQKSARVSIASLGGKEAIMALPTTNQTPANSNLASPEETVFDQDPNVQNEEKNLN